MLQNFHTCPRSSVFCCKHTEANAVTCADPGSLHNYSKSVNCGNCKF